MEIDSVFKQGYDHKICQDYSVHGSTPFPYWIISDGSSSSHQTEIGAKLLALTAQKLLKEHSLEKLQKISSCELGKRIIQRAEYIAKQLGIDENALDATLIVSWYDPDFDVINTCVYGDGVIFYKKKNNLYHYHFEYEENYPFYLSYELNPERLELLEKQINQKYIISLASDAHDQLFTSTNDMKHRPKIQIKGDELEWFCIASDGIESFDSINFSDIIQKISQFKHFKGVFLERRVNKMIKELNKDNINHYDDLSLACFYKGQKSQEE